TPSPLPTPSPSPRSLPLDLLAAIALFTLGNSTDALLLLRAQSAGVPTAHLPLLSTLLHVLRAALSWPLGRLAARPGRRRALGASVAAGVLWDRVGPGAALGLGAGLAALAAALLLASDLFRRR